MKGAEFNERAADYKFALDTFPNARQAERDIVLKLLQPEKTESVVDLASGNGYIAVAIAPHCRKLYAVDASAKQLESLVRGTNIVAVECGDSEVPVGDGEVDAIYSVGGFHHMKDHHKLLKECHRVLKNRGKLLLCDVKEGSTVARHFDDRVARYCKTGHHRSWINPEYFASLCYTAGFSIERTATENAEWIFDAENDIGIFLKYLHGMTCTTAEALEGAYAHLAIKFVDGKYRLEWPLFCGLAVKK